MIYQVTSPHGNDHFLTEDEARVFARKWSELLKGKFVVWCDNLVKVAFRDGREIAS